MPRSRARDMIDRSRHTQPTGRVTAVTLFAIAVLHALWAMGSSFPFRTRDELADSVVGTKEVPSPTACLAVASALVAAAVIVRGVVPMPARVRRFALHAISGVLATRGVAGALGRTSTLSPGSDSPTFNRLDKRLYSPLCLWLAAGVQRSL